MIATNLNVNNILSKYCQKDDFNNYVSSQLSVTQCEEFYQLELLNEKSNIFSYIGSNNTELETLESWINVYFKNDFNEIHNHTDQKYIDKCDHTGILILECGANEKLIIYDSNNQAQFFNVSAGEIYIVNNNTLHGLDAVKEKVIALMFMIKG